MKTLSRALAFISGLLLFPLSASALTGVTVPSLKSGNNLVGAVVFIVNAFLVLVSVLALIYIIIGGVKYITSAGDEKGFSSAKNTILYAIIGLIVIGLAAVIVNFTVSTI